MTNLSGVERRVGQRFPYLLPLSLRQPATSLEGVGFTQDLSSRGVFFFTDAPLTAGSEIELTLRMPSEITLGENMRVRCRGSVLRIVKPTDKDNGWKPTPLAETEKLAGIKAAETKISETKLAEAKVAEAKIGVAVCLKGYEYLPETESGSADFRRISALHTPTETQRPAVPGVPRVPVL